MPQFTAMSGRAPEAELRPHQTDWDWNR